MPTAPSPTRRWCLRAHQQPLDADVRSTWAAPTLSRPTGPKFASSHQRNIATSPPQYSWALHHKFPSSREMLRASEHRTWHIILPWGDASKEEMGEVMECYWVICLTGWVVVHAELGIEIGMDDDMMMMIFRGYIVNFPPNWTKGGRHQVKITSKQASTTPSNMHACMQV